jgi:hypothetical protein
MLTRMKQLLALGASQGAGPVEFPRKHRLSIKRLLACALVIGGVCVGWAVGAVAYADDRPVSQAVLSAQKTSDLMLATLFAALGQEFTETTAENVEQGKRSISLIFNDKNKDMRLVGVLNALRANDFPQDSFEATALVRAMSGQNYNDVQRVDDKWYYRRSVALSNFHPACVLCHTNFGPMNNTQWVGALMLRVPITDRDD